MKNIEKLRRLFLHCSPMTIFLLSAGGIVQPSPAIGSEATAPETPFVSLNKISVNHLVTEVLRRNSNIPAMVSAWEASKARIMKQKTLDDPTLSFLIAPQTIAQDDVDFGHKISISQRLLWPGKRELRTDVARFESKAVYEGISRARLNLIESSQIAFSEWYYAHAAVRINKINRSLLKEFHNIAEIKYAAGQTSHQDVLRAEVEVALLEHRDIVLQRKQREAKSIINTLLQRSPDLAVPPPEPFSIHHQAISISELRHQALSHHPDITALQARINASNSRLTLSEREFYPDIHLSAAYNSLWNQPKKRFTLGASINIPLTSFRRSVSDENRAIRLQLEALKKSMTADILDKLQRAYEQVVENQHVLNLFRKRLLPLAKENLAAAQSDYESGNGEFLNLISADKNLTQTQLHMERARADYQQRWARLEHASAGLIPNKNKSYGIEKNKVKVEQK